MSDYDDTQTASSESNSPGFQYTPGFAELLEELRISLLVSTYQAGKVAVVRAWEGRLNVLLRTLERPMGLAVSRDRLAIGTRNQVWILANAPSIAAQLTPRDQFDACFVPRRSHVTGDIQVHELAWAGSELWLVNTRFSCLCTLDEDYSFVPRWRPPFVSALARAAGERSPEALAQATPRAAAVAG